MNYQQRQQEKENRMKKLIQQALDRFDAEDLLTMLHDVAGDQMEGIEHKAKDILCQSGFFICRVPSMVKAAELEQFVNERIYPSYNEQSAFVGMGLY